MKNSLFKVLFFAVAVLGLAWNGLEPVMAENYTASVMRLLHYEGNVEILAPSGDSRFVMENVRFDSGETMRTGSGSSASVGMDESKIVTLDENTSVEFARKGKAMELNLQEGRLLLDVQEKLDENETFDIQTATMVVGIRGTIVYVNTRQEVFGMAEADAAQATSDAEKADAAQAFSEMAETAAFTQLGVLEGSAQITYREGTGTKRQLSVHAGQKVTLPDPDQDGVVDAAPVIEMVTAQDMAGFLNDQMEKDPALKKRVEDAAKNAMEQQSVPADRNSNGQNAEVQNDAAGGSWTWSAPVTLVAQSASKLYDGQPLMRPSDVLVYGLPAQFDIRVNASGSQTDAGTGTNVIASYAIFNGQGEDVTSHFTNIQTVSGRLIVDPAPIYVWTASAQKRYDGLPLTQEDALLHSTAGYESKQMPWRNSSYVITRNAGSGSAGETQTFYDNEILYGICGAVWVHGTNPLTGEAREMQLLAGQKMTVHLRDEREGQSIEFLIETISEEEIPEEILCLYADNPDLLAQACADTGWDAEKIAEQIAALAVENAGQSEEAEKEGGAGQSREEEKGGQAGQSEEAGQAGATVEKDSLKLRAGVADRLMTDSTNVRINIDTTITSYNDRFLGSDEAHYTPIQVDDDIRITPTGSQTQVGESVNTYEIDWGSENPGNFILNEELGTLRVTPAGAVVSTGSAYKEYDGTPLTSEAASITGLVNGETAMVTATGSQTEPGTSINTYSITWGSANSANYALTENLGVLTVTVPRETEEPETEEPETEPVTETEDPGQDAAVIFTAASAQKGYDGTPLTNPEVIADGLPEGYSFAAQATGSQTDAGSSQNTVSSYQILNEDGQDVTDDFADITTVSGTLTVTPAKATVITKSVSREYDGTVLAGGAGAADGESPETKVKAAVETIVTFVETTKSASGESTGGASAAGRSGMQNDASGSLPGSVQASDGSAILSGLASADVQEITIEATGTITKPGTIENSYQINWGSAKAGNYTLTENLGTLEVTKNTTPITITAGSSAKVYDGTALTNGTVKAEGIPAALTYTAKAAGSRTDAGTSENTISSYHILDAEGEDVTDAFADISTVSGTLIVRPAPVTVTTGSASKEYDGTPLTVTSASITGLTDADASTAAVRATGTITKVGTTNNTFEIDWGSAKESNYTVTEETGTLEVTKNTSTIIFTAGSASKVFDGTPLTEEHVTAEGLPSACTWSAETSGSITDVGSSDNLVSSCRILNSDGEDVTAFFSGIQTLNGTLVVDPLKLNVDLGGETFVYDGTSHYALPVGTYENGEHAGEALAISSMSACDEEIPGTVDFSLFSGDLLQVTYLGYAYDVDTSDIWEEHSFTEGKESNYRISFTNGSFTVTPATLTITTGSAQKIYDGKALISSEITVAGLVPSDTGWEYGDVVVTATGSQTEVGESTNTYEIDWGWIWPNNYTVIENLGTLKVEKQKLAISFGGETLDYDGRVHDRNPEITYVNGSKAGEYAEKSGAIGGSDGITVTTFLLYNGDELVVTLVPPEANVGSYTITGNIVAQTGKLEDYEITITDTVHTIRPVQATVTTGSATKEYDGEALVSAEASITGLIDGEAALVTAAGTQTEVGESTNTYTIDWGTTNPANYILVENLGTLKVTEAEMSSDSAEVENGAEGADTKAEAADTKDEAEGTKVEGADAKDEAEGTKVETEGTKVEAADTKAETESTRVEGADAKDEAEGTKVETEGTKVEAVDTKVEAADIGKKTSDSKKDVPDVEEVTPDTQKVVPDTEETEAQPTKEKAEEKASVPTMEKAEEKASEPTTEKAEEKASESTTEKVEEKASEPAKEKAEEKASEPTTEKAEEKASEPTTEKAEEKASESTTEKVEEKTSEPAMEKTEENSGTGQKESQGDGSPALLPDN